MIVLNAQCQNRSLWNIILSCRDLLAAPFQEATELLQGRMPVPKLLECDQGGSQVGVNTLLSCLLIFLTHVPQLSKCDLGVTQVTLATFQSPHSCIVSSSMSNLWCQSDDD